MTMHVRDASGRRVSLLNDDDTTGHHHHYQQHQVDPSYAAYYAHAPRSVSSSPNTPELLRSDSYDSQMGSEPMSPMTPLNDPRYAGAAVDPYVHQYDDYYVDQMYAASKRPAVLDTRAVSYEEDITAHTTSTERPGKRFPCRYRDSHGCEKTFTTSGHASRHSKIHTAEKAVPCSFPGCTKKFTRADNMKQHLETHYKDKTRSSSSRPSLSSSDRRGSSSSKSSRAKSNTTAGASLGSTTPLASPGGVWDLRDLSAPLLSRPTIARTSTAGLDALAMAVACQPEV
ncbi:hypothetical protein B0T21DRAFT_348020 [Apiosordaria backusii]|uniref:C2H2-type domain-containing protein n=1 Tax=Apiosordaria backusii TaxID=314023 RepID=A0AA40BNV8_9PEZI|nr:hypothetical protein B0T21DRAFT_348020 [Apiosordaria backusii]